MEYFARTNDAARKYVVSGEGQIASPSFVAGRREICELRESIAKPRDNMHLTVPKRTIARHRLRPACTGVQSIAKWSATRA